MQIKIQHHIVILNGSEGSYAPRGTGKH